MEGEGASKPEGERECSTRLINKKKVLIHLLLLSMTLILFAAPFAKAEAWVTQTYIVLYKKLQVPAETGAVIAAAGGTLVYGYGSQSEQGSSRDRRGDL